MKELTVYRENTFERLTRLGGLFVLAPLLLLLTIPVAIQIAQKPELGFSVHRLQVFQVLPAGPASGAGLLQGDRVLAVNGRAVASMSEYYAAVSGNFSHAPVSLTVARGFQDLTVVVQPVRPSQATLIKSYSLWVAGLAFLMIGWWVLLRRVDPVARNFFSLCFGFAFFLLDVPDIDYVAYMTAKEYLRNLLQFMLPAFFLRFFLLFPGRSRQGTRRGRTLRLLLFPGLLLFLVAAGYELLGVPVGSRSEMVLEAVALVYMLGYFLAGLVIFARKVLRRDRPIQQTKMKVILVGLIGGLVPFFAGTLLSNLAPDTTLPHLQYLALSLLLVPASFGLAIMRYGALDKAFVVRVGLIYGLVTLLVVLAYLGIVLILGALLSDVFQASATPVLLGLMAASSLAVMPVRRLAQGWIDRTFYPARRANRQAMAHLADRLAGLIDSEEVISTLLFSLENLFRPTSFALFLGASGDEDHFRARLADPVPGNQAPPGSAPQALTLPRTSGLGILLDRIRRPVFTEEIEDLLFSGETDADSLNILTRLRAQLLVPMVSGNRLLGFMGFGPKSSGELYSQEDLANLRAVAVQAASQVESRQLYQESLETRRLETELQVARKIQSRLLPTGPLDTGAAVICGRNEPCRMVGGDYFDYFSLPDGTLAFAIADVSGKGIPAALMMTSFRVAFRQEARAGATPHEVVARLNPAVTKLVSDGAFICFFFGIWQAATGLLSYCNAGMDPPVLIRPGSSYRQRLKKGGPVLGVDRSHRYREGSLELRPGDRVFLYTDGLTEATNPAGDFYDTTRLLDLVQNNIEASPSRLLATIFSTVNAFGGEERSDDKTAIILEIKHLG